MQELVNECDLTPLHMASFSGSDDVVRALLNSSGTSVSIVCQIYVAKSLSYFFPLRWMLQQHRQD